ncbi:YtxH domain-containing protein [Streptococcus sp. sy004]|uniref:YtxH domain-containing protein n=1 Tax=Streptococcus sp. sy004 TaxID=2600149 RepID=UPI0011B39462|nr:YtxH domain-containing protein [Streptococcus sp. sy004]TWT10473.1 YtxH domain-containing protein [Streptococcus sp. sy004]
MSKFFRTVLFGSLSGATAAYLLTSKEGKILQSKAKDFIVAYQENPEAYHELVKEKIDYYRQQMIKKVQSYQEDLQTTLDKDAELTGQAEKLPEVSAYIDDIVLDYDDVINKKK